MFVNQNQVERSNEGGFGNNVASLGNGGIRITASELVLLWSIDFLNMLHICATNKISRD